MFLFSDIGNIAVYLLTLLIMLSTITSNFTITCITLFAYGNNFTKYLFLIVSFLLMANKY